MKWNKLLLFALFIVALQTGCKPERQFAVLKDSSTYKTTAFLTTIEHEIPTNKNAIYSASFLFAWQKVKKLVDVPYDANDNSTDLSKLNNSDAHIGTLRTSEYTATVEVNGGLITARAEFSKSLPFDLPLESYSNKLVFDNTKVASFGLYGSDKMRSEIVTILYYKDDNNFIIKLSPSDKKHEIILFKSEDTYLSMIELNKAIAEFTKTGNKEKDNIKLAWKYKLADEDIVVIPKFNFNVETNYMTLEGLKIKTHRDSFQIHTAWQRTAFILDELGAVIESQAEVVLAVDADTEAKPKPKKLVFDKPFLIFLKRVDAENPYFGIWNANAALMVKE
jgi:hypothetical protein